MATAEITTDSVTRNNNEGYFVRFGVRQRIEHIVLLVSFTVLSITGLAQRYYTSGWGEWIIMGMGGIEFTRLVHRGFAVVFTLGIIYHIVYVMYSFFIRHEKLAMLPTLKDFRDVVEALRYGFGFTDKPPLFGRFDYRQKLEYWGLTLGGMVITVTGFILAFPLAITSILPGQVVAAAVDIHGYEATLAVLTIVIWHLYDVIFRPDIFPADTTIFTGRISRKRMLEEHPLEYAEMKAVREVAVPETSSSDDDAESD